MQDISRSSVPVTGPSSPPPGIAAVRLRDLVLVVAVTAAVILLLRLAVPATLRGSDMQVLLLGVQSAVPLLAVHLVIVRGRGLSWQDLGLREAPRGWYLRAVLLTLLVLPLVALVNGLTQSLTGGPVRNPQIDVLAPIAASPAGRFGIVVMAGIVAPIVEEIVFRGLFYGWLRARMGIAAATVLSALVFAAVHGIVILIPALFVHGMILAVLYERSGSLWPPIIVHGLFNTLMALALFAALAAGVLGS